MLCRPTDSTTTALVEQLIKSVIYQSAEFVGLSSVIHWAEYNESPANARPNFASLDKCGLPTSDVPEYEADPEGLDVSNGAILSPDHRSTEVLLCRFVAVRREYFRKIRMKKTLIRGMQAKITETVAST